MARLAGVWENSVVGYQPESRRARKDPYIEHYEAHPTDAQTNGPQPYYGLRYHAHIIQPGEVETFPRPSGLLVMGAWKQAIFY